MSTALSNEEIAAWVRLAMEPGLGAAQARNLLAAIGLPQHIYDLSISALSKYLPSDMARQLRSGPTELVQSTIDKTLAWLKNSNHHMLTLADPSYPQTLLDIHDPPLVLYANGDIKLLQQPSLAIVGARNATQAGADNALAFAKHLAGQGWCIVSGLALGIDTAAHQGAMASSHGGSTIAVLGTGIDIVYPARNRDLAHRIADSGLLLTEFPLGTGALPWQFPKRNRIVAGLCKGVLVVEAARQSGSLITARMATEMGREVFAIPGSIHSPLSRGCHALIRQGAKLVESAQDISDELGLPTEASHKVNTSSPGNPSKTEQVSKPPTTERVSKHLEVDTPPAATLTALTSTTARQILDALGHDPVSTDTLQQRTALDISALQAQLLQLELSQHITQLPDGRYQARP